MNTLKTIYYFPGLIKWCQTLMSDCLECQKNKAVRKDLNTAPLLSPVRDVRHAMHTISIDYKGPINPISNGKAYILVIVDF